MYVCMFHNAEMYMYSTCIYICISIAVAVERYVLLCLPVQLSDIRDRAAHSLGLLNEDRHPTAEEGGDATGHDNGECVTPLLSVSGP